MSQPFVIPLEDNLVIRGDVHGPKDVTGERPVVLICHGFKGYKDWNFFPYLAEQLAKSGFFAIRFNFSCNGVGEALEHFDELDKFAINTYSREQADLSSLFEQIVQRALPFSDQFDLKRIGIIGHSRGGANSIIFAAEHPEIKAVVTWNSVSHVDFFPDSLKKQIREQGIGYVENARTKEQMPMKANVFDDMIENVERFNIMNHLKRITTPVHIIQGDADNEWLVSGASAMKTTASIHSLAMIREGDHTFNAAHPLKQPSTQLKEAMDETIHFLQEKL